MMKRFIILWLSLVAIVFSCNKDDRKASLREVINDEVAIKAYGLHKVFENYYHHNLKEYNGLGVIVVNSRTSGDTTVLKVSSILNDLSIQRKPALFYSFDAGVPVVFYSGLEELIMLDTARINKMNEFIGQYLERPRKDKNGVFLDPPSTYNPVVWEVIMLNGEIIDQQRVN